MPTRVPPGAEPSARLRILAATFVVLARSGRTKLMLSEVAAEAKVSRPTLYKYFSSKQALLDAFATYEQDNFEAGIATAVAGLRGSKRLDAALQFIVDFQTSYSLSFLAEIEPEHVLAHIDRAIPLMHERIVRIIPGEHAEVAAATVVRVAVCHYLVKGKDPINGKSQFLAELRFAAGLDPARPGVARTHSIYN